MKFIALLLSLFLVPLNPALADHYEESTVEAFVQGTLFTGGIQRVQRDREYRAAGRHDWARDVCPYRLTDRSAERHIVLEGSIVKIRTDAELSFQPVYG